MPTISSFYGITISMYWGDHLPGHFHARYQDFEAVFDLEGELLEGAMPPRQRRIISGWAAIHQEELEQDWARAVSREELALIRGIE